MQNFRHSNQVSAYIHHQPVMPAPQTGQFTSIASTGAGTVVSIQQGALQIQRNGANVGYFTRNIDFGPNPATLLFQFSFEVPACSADSAINSHSTFLFRIGEGYDNTGGTSNLGSTFVNLGIRLTGNPNEFFFRNLHSGVDSKIFEGKQVITWVMNRSGAAVEYAAPNGTTENLANNRWDLWVGTEQVFNDATPQNSSFRLAQFKCMYNSLSNIKNFQVRFDNFYVNTLNGTLLNSHDFLVGHQGDFESLTNPGGVFHVLNNLLEVPAQGYRFKISSNLWETGANPLRAVPGMSAGNHVVFVPDGTKNRQIEGEGHSFSGLIRLEGATYVHFDGRNPQDMNAQPGQGLLTIRNLEGDRPTIWLNQGASHNTFTGCNIAGKPTGMGIVSMGNGGSQPNMANIFLACSIAGLGNGAHFGFHALADRNHQVVIKDCEIYNVFHPQGISTYLHVGTGNHGWEIAENQFQAVGTKSCAGTCQASFLHLEGWGHAVKNNSFGGIGPQPGAQGRWETTNPTATFALKAVTVNANHTQLLNNTVGFISMATDGVPLSDLDIFVAYGINGENLQLQGNKVEMVEIDAQVASKAVVTGFKVKGTLDGYCQLNIVQQVEGNFEGTGQVSAYGFQWEGQCHSGYDVHKNKVGKLAIHTSGAVEATVLGMAFEKVTGNGVLEVSSNHVHQLEGGGLAWCYGFLFEEINTRSKITNNQLALGRNITSDAQIAGIGIGPGGTGMLEIFHNSVVLEGQVTGVPNQKTYALYREEGQHLVLKGNLFHNLRQGGDHYALGSLAAQPWQASRNLLYAPDPQKIGIWGANSFNFPTWCSDADRGELYSFANISGSMPYLTEGNLVLHHDGAVALHAWVIDQGPFAHEVAGLQVDFEGNFRRGRNDIGASEVYVAWIGGAPGQETNWHEPSNWSLGEVPGCNQAGMVKIYPVTYPPTVFQSALFQDLVIAEGAELKIEAMGNLSQCPVATENGSLVNSGQIWFTASGSQHIRLMGDLLNNGWIDSEGGVWQFAGDSAQQIGGRTLTKFHHLQIHGSGPKYLRQDVAVGHALEFIQGLLFTDVFALSVERPDATVSATPNSYLVGTLQRAVAAEDIDYFFPVGGRHYRAAATLRFQNLAGISSLKASFDDGYLGEILAQPLHSVSPDATYGYTCAGGKWQILPHGGDAALAIYQLQVEGHGLSCGGTNITIAKKTGAATASFAGSAYASHPFTRTGFTGFTEYVALTDFSLLGLQWREITAVPLFPGVALQWSVEQRMAEGSFIVHRSVDGQHFQRIGHVGAQPEAGVHTYRFHDTKGLHNNQMVYYQVAYQAGGQVWESRVIAIRGESNATATIHVGPNPVQGTLFLEGLSPATYYTVLITSLTGKVFWSQKCTTSCESMEIPAVQGLQPGMYLLVLVSPDGKQVFKILKE